MSIISQLSDQQEQILIEVFVGYWKNPERPEPVIVSRGRLCERIWSHNQENYSNVHQGLASIVNALNNQEICHLVANSINKKRGHFCWEATVHPVRNSTGAWQIITKFKPPPKQLEFQYA